MIEIYKTPVGNLCLRVCDGSLCLCDWMDSPKFRTPSDSGVVSAIDASVMCDAISALDRFFNVGESLPLCNIPLSASGTPFQTQVWHSLRSIPHGATVSYRDIAVAIGRPSAVRAVASAVGSNVISIFIPCHRVVGADGSLTGYRGGILAKRHLLSLETNKLL